MNNLYFGDNLDVMREHIRDETVDLVYLDPPFNSNADYNALFREPDGTPSAEQMEVFRDTWNWGEDAEGAFDEIMRGGGDLAALVNGLGASLGRSQLLAYLSMMAVRLIELRRVLKQNGSLYLHCDPTASHYLKVVLDAVFGSGSFRSEVIWKRSGAHNDTKQGRRGHGRIHDTILFYTKGSEWTWNPVFTPYSDEYTGRDYRLIDEKSGKRFRRGDLTAAKPGGDTSYDWRVKKRAGERVRWEADLDDEWRTPQKGWEYKAVGPYAGRYWAYSHENMAAFAREGRIRHTFDGRPEYKRFIDDNPGVSLQDLWADISPLVAGQKERLGYATQKPVALLERIIESSSDPDQLVLDPFCGCGTTIEAAERLGRRWIGIDVAHYGISLIERRLQQNHPLARYSVEGRPTTIQGARNLAERDPHQFQVWAAWRLGAQTYRQIKKGADRGIDGRIHFQNGPYGWGAIIISVKSGENVGPAAVRDLRGVIDRERAEIGVLVTLTPPTKRMEEEAVAAGFVERSAHGRRRRLLIFTAEDLLAGEHERALPPLPIVDLTSVRPKTKQKKRKPVGQLEMMLPIGGETPLPVAPDELVDPRFLDFGQPPAGKQQTAKG